MTDDKLLRADQVAKRLNISKSYVYQLMDRGALSVVVLGDRCKRVPESEVERVRQEGVKENG